MSRFVVDPSLPWHPGAPQKDTSFMHAHAFDGAILVSRPLHAAIESEIADRVAEALRSKERAADMTIDKHLPASATWLPQSAAVHAVLRDGEWRVSAKLHAAIAEALRSQLPEDAPDEPGAWQGRMDSVGRREVWNPRRRMWSADTDMLHAAGDVWGIYEAVRVLCTEPEQLTMPMRARREWRRLGRRADDHTDPEHEVMWKRFHAQAAALRLLLTDSGEPL